MIDTAFDLNALAVQMRMREMRAYADAQRRARQAYRPGRLRRRVGSMLILAGESLTR
jgi:hypothetical protein